jgi:hypothetical protein
VRYENALEDIEVVDDCGLPEVGKGVYARSWQPRTNCQRRSTTSAYTRASDDVAVQACGRN